MFLFRWAIEKIEGFPEVNGMVDVVGTVHWELEIRDTEDHSVHYIREATSLDAPDPDNFIDHLELTSEQLLQWVWDVVGKETTEQRIVEELAALRAPKTGSVQMSMPWLATCCPDGQGIDQDPVVTSSSQQ